MSGVGKVNGVADGSGVGVGLGFEAGVTVTVGVLDGGGARRTVRSPSSLSRRTLYAPSGRDVLNSTRAVPEAAKAIP